MQKTLISIITALIIGSIVSAAGAYVKVQVLEVKVGSNKEALAEIKQKVNKIWEVVGAKNFCR